MKRKLLVIITLIASLAFTAFVACSNIGTTKSTSGANNTNSVSANTAQNNSLQHDLKLIVTSDIHAGVDQNLTLPKIVEMRKELEKEGNHTLLIDDGDILQGGLLSSESEGEDLIDIINTAGYDILTPGNHDFDYGMDRFFSNTEKLNTPYISCNFTKNDELIFDPYIIKEFDGVKFAFIGISTPETLTTSNPEFFKDENDNFIYGFMQGNDGQTLYNKVQEMVDEVKSKGASYVIAVAHIGNKEMSKPYRYTDIISNVHGIDVFLDGHSHDTDQVVMKDKEGRNTIRMGLGTKLNCVGVVTFTTSGEIKHDLIKYEAPKEGETEKKYENEVSKLIDERLKIIGDKMSKVIGTTNYTLSIYDPEAKDSQGVPIRIVRRMETNLGDLIADAYKEKTGADCAMVNGGGVRIEIPKGEIKIVDIKNVQPFNNVLCLMEVTGQQILDALEWGCSACPGENGAFPQVSGMTFELDTSIENPCKKDENGMCAGIEGERRVKNLKINGTPVDPEKKYKFTTLSYIASEHGDGHTAFDDSKILKDNIGTDYLIVVEYIEKTLGGKIPEKYSNPYGDERIIIHNE